MVQGLNAPPHALPRVPAVSSEAAAAAAAVAAAGAAAGAGAAAVAAANLGTGAAAVAAATEGKPVSRWRHDRSTDTCTAPAPGVSI